MALVKANWLDGATTAGTVTDPEEVTGAVRFGLQTSTTGNPTSAMVMLQGSIDGVQWFELERADSPVAELVGYGAGGNHAVVRYIRLRVEALSGGTSPTVSASVVAV